nr:ATP-binding cassette sub-family G member 1-like [Leptinotarsa decemlineata]
MVSVIDNGRNSYNEQAREAELQVVELGTGTSISSIRPDVDLSETGSSNFEHESGWMRQFSILIMRMWLQMWRDKNYLLLRTVLHLVLGVFVGFIYLGMGQDGSKTIFNFGFYFCCLIFFMYIPMMPILLQCEYE